MFLPSESRMISRLEGKHDDAARRSPIRSWWPDKPTAAACLHEPRHGHRVTRLREAVYAPPVKSCPRIGSERSRLPVAAKIALVTAGWIMVAPGSPTPPHRLPGVGEM